MLLRNDSLELRALEPEDGEAVMAILENPVVSVNLFGFPAKAAEMGYDAWRRAASLFRNDFYFAVTERTNPRVIGICAYQGIDYRNGRTDIWAAVTPDYIGGIDLLLLLTQTAFNHLRIEHIALPCLAYDARMISLAEQAGFSQDSIFYSRIKKNGNRYDIIIYTLLKGEGGNTP